jgi:hypothetical protein
VLVEFERNEKSKKKTFCDSMIGDCQVKILGIRTLQIGACQRMRNNKINNDMKEKNRNKNTSEKECRQWWI